MATEPETLQFANLTFRGLQRETLLRDDGRLKAIITVNAEIIVEANRNPKLAAIINNNWATLDGQWPYLLARRTSRVRPIEKISGSDFVYELCEFAGHNGHRVFLLGAAAEVNREACARLRKDFGIQTEGYSPPNRPFPFPRAEDEEILARLREFRPQIVVVCFGSPKQELWADLHNETLDRMGVRWVIGAGGTLDFIAGAVKRAPVLFQKAGLESVWRLALEPRSRIRRVLRAFQFFRYI